MSRIAEFEFIGFTPRRTFREQANRALAGMFDLAPKHSQCVAKVVRVQNVFRIEVQIKTPGDCFQASMVVDPNRHDNTIRDWQMQGIKRVVSQLMNQFEYMSAAA